MRKATHQEAADHLGLSKKTIGNLVQGKKKTAMMIGIAAILDEEKAKKKEWQKKKATEDKV